MKIITLLFSVLLILGCSKRDPSINFQNPFEPDDVSFPDICDNDDVVYLDTNGITVKAYSDAYSGSCGKINGVTYLVVDDSALRYYIQAGREASTIVTTLVTDMSELFSNDTDFNQNIGSWDVSNVQDMTSMFYNATEFNQDIVHWDVSSVTDMTAMFDSAIAFNQDLSSWNVDTVIKCDDFYNNTPQWTLPKPNFTNCIPNNLNYENK